MMSKKVPELRFKGFTDDWEERKLGDLATSFEYGLNASAKSFDGTHKYIRITDIDDSSRKFNSQSLTSPDIDLSSADNYKLKNGDILFARTGASVGKSYIYDDSDGLVYYAGFLIRARIKSGVDSNFVFQHTLTSSYENFIRVISQRSGQPGVNAKEYSTFEISVPSYEEQRKIGSFLKQLDDIIALHQRKLDLLKEQKKGFLQKMFPKNGAKVPELRFKGFTDDWEERKLSDLFIKGGSGGTPKSTNKAFYDGDIPFLSISDITKSNGFINNTEKHISSDGLNSSAAWIVPKGAISLAMYASVGKLAILNIDAATSQAFYNMIFDDYDLRDLVYQRLNKANELSEWNKLISTGTQSNLNADKVKNFQMYLPKNHDEIKLISTFFKQLDDTIALHQRKLDLLKEQKKGFLQKMFV
ncbi:restriction endonuclease subunit S [Streptococcus thermophilus]|nr:restriction endonuclease subunit S [Streptococcus thermophilus]MCE2329523.1 restriction endonuclease subunit S [Streptococcus thermophilus]MCE2331804.1 restriction endonuclease subunit S [Streptococcus thermophilus]MCE2335661.1 restriction endonuclease subunit S [Streptococcus thermophilus]MCE2336793.1 restriction endonuclease subunit S [Streptococcus thermophilus]